MEDLRALNGIIGPNEFLEALDNEPAGVFDARSWAYWNLKYERSPASPRPERVGLQTEPAAG